MTQYWTSEQRAAGMPFSALAGQRVLDPTSGNAMAERDRGCVTAIFTAKRPTRHLGRSST